MIGKALKQLPRPQVQLATKFGFLKSADGQFAVKGTPEYARQCCEASLSRLAVDYIDLYFQHRVDVGVPIEDTMGELKKLVEEGKIKYVGLSEASPDTIRRAHAVHPITAVQMEYSLWSRDIEDEIIPLCRELGIGIVAYSPLGHGFFGGKAIVESLPPESVMAIHPRFKGENLEKNKVLYRKFADMAAKHGCTPPQLALAWLLHQGNDIVPIPGTCFPTYLFRTTRRRKNPCYIHLFGLGQVYLAEIFLFLAYANGVYTGTTKIKNLEENTRSLTVKLNPEDVREIRDAVAVEDVSGEREFEMLAGYSWKYANTPMK